MRVIINLIHLNILANIVTTNKEIKILEIGQYCFYIGTIFLSTTIFISGLLFLISLLISVIYKKSSIKKDKWNLILFIFSAILVLNSINISLIENQNSVYTLLRNLSWNPSSVWLSLFNWIPFFLVFSGLQIYLKTELQRSRFAKCLFAGIIPVILGILLLKWFHVNGPFVFLNGLIDNYIISWLFGALIGSLNNYLGSKYLLFKK